MTKEEFLKVIAPLAAVCTADELTADKLNVWYMVLGDIDAATLRAAVLHVLATHESNFLPPPAVIRRAAGEMAIQARGLPSSYEAYDMAVKAVQSWGRARRPDLPEIVMRAIDGIGGWVHFCNSENPEALRSRFVSAYEQYKHRAETEVRALPAVNRHIAQLAAKLTDVKQLEA